MSQLSIFRGAIASSFTALMLISCQTSDLGTSSPTQEPLSNVQKSATNPKAVQGLTYGPIVNIDGEDYYLAGVPDGMNGATDIPGHYWRRTGDNALIGKHFNTGLFGKAKWWNSSVPDGALLYIVNGEIAEWSLNIAKEKAKMGFVHSMNLCASLMGNYILQRYSGFSTSLFGTFIWMVALIQSSHILCVQGLTPILFPMA